MFATWLTLHLCIFMYIQVQFSPASWCFNECHGKSPLAIRWAYVLTNGDYIIKTISKQYPIHILLTITYMIFTASISSPSLHPSCPTVIIKPQLISSHSSRIDLPFEFTTFNIRYHQMDYIVLAQFQAQHLGMGPFPHGCGMPPKMMILIGKKWWSSLIIRKKLVVTSFFTPSLMMSHVAEIIRNWGYTMFRQPTNEPFFAG